jgi:hypothetical protein
MHKLHVLIVILYLRFPKRALVTCQHFVREQGCHNILSVENVLTYSQVFHIPLVKTALLSLQSVFKVSDISSVAAKVADLEQMTRKYCFASKNSPWFVKDSCLQQLQRNGNLRG